MLIFNRDVNGKYLLPEDGWFHLAPVGKVILGDRETADGKKVPVKQRLTKRGLQRMVERFEQAAKEPNFPGLLVDFEHFSHDNEKSTEAAGWIEGLENRDTGLWAKIRLSDLGESAIQGGRYRGISPVWDGPEVEPGVIEPDELFDAGLTNKPNLRGMVPLSNRKRTAQTDTNTKPTEGNHMNKIIALLGLSAEASEDAVADAVGKIQNRASQFDELKPKYDELLGVQADADLDAHGIKDEATRKELRPALIENRAQALSFLKLTKREEKREKAAPVHNRQGAATPGTDLTDEENAAATAKAEARAAKIANRARALRSVDKALSLPASYAQAEAEIAEEETAK